MTCDMTDEEMAAYRFRVGKMRFEDLADAINYARGCLYASHVVFVPTGVTIWTDGDLEPGRPGAFVLRPYRSPKPNPRDW